MVVQPHVSRVLDAVHNVGSSLVLAHHHCVCNKHQNIRVQLKYFIHIILTILEIREVGKALFGRSCIIVIRGNNITTFVPCVANWRPYK